MSGSRVAVLDDGSLWLSAAVRLLESREGVEIICVPCGAAAWVTLSRFRPDVVVTSNRSDAGAAALLRLMGELPRTRVVVLSEDQPPFQVHRGRPVEAATVDGFLDAVTGSYVREGPRTTPGIGTMRDEQGGGA